MLQKQQVRQSQQQKNELPPHSLLEDIVGERSWEINLDCVLLGEDLVLHAI